MKIKVGKTYIARNGEKLTVKGPHKDCPSRMKTVTSNGVVIELSKEGKYWTDGAESDWDVVSIHASRKKKRIKKLEERVEKLEKNLQLLEDLFFRQRIVEIDP